MLFNVMFVHALNIITIVLDFLLPFDPVSRLVAILASISNYLPTIVKVIADVYFFFPKEYLSPLLSFMAAIMALRIGISVWHLFPWGKFFG